MKLKVLLYCLLLFVFSSCQSLKTKEEFSKESLSSLKLDTRVRVTDLKQNKSQSIRANWIFKQPDFMRLDILGPFDIVMAQAFRTPETTTLVDHREKKYLIQKSNQALKIDNYTLPLKEITEFFLEPNPRSWTCHSIEQTSICEKNSIKISRSANSNYSIETLEAKIEIETLSRSENQTLDNKIFVSPAPSSYQAL